MEFTNGFPDAPELGIVRMAFKASFVSEGKHLVIDAGGVSDAEDGYTTVDQLFADPGYCHITLSADQYLILTMQGFVNGFY